MKDAEERLKKENLPEDDKSLIIHIISTGELEIIRLKEELNHLKNL